MAATRILDLTAQQLYTTDELIHLLAVLEGILQAESWHVRRTTLPILQNVVFRHIFDLSDAITARVLALLSASLEDAHVEVSVLPQRARLGHAQANRAVVSDMASTPAGMGCNQVRELASVSLAGILRCSAPQLVAQLTVCGPGTEAQGPVQARA